MTSNISTIPAMNIPKQPKAIFISHGGGPLPVLGDPGHAQMVTALQDIAHTIEAPSAIIVISAHWEEPVATITGNPRPPIIYDYYGFPEESYQLQYPAPGDPELATHISTCIEAQGLPVVIDNNRGFDHGLFIPLLLMYPQANIPCIQVSLVADFDPMAHIRLGQAMAQLDPGILVIGSGFSFHNMRAFFQSADGIDERNVAFEQWLHQTCTSESITEDERTDRLLHWDNAPAARYCHPREEHLMPLHVCYGVGGNKAESITLEIINKRSSMYFW